MPKSPTPENVTDMTPRQLRARGYADGNDYSDLGWQNFTAEDHRRVRDDIDATIDRQAEATERQRRDTADARAQRLRDEEE
ncbi:MAG: hypothetical protein Q8P18_24920 [Pseudomonadota bacterium]|nr:hypothetical protein [Pseudomonadota bacterium]